MMVESTYDTDEAIRRWDRFAPTLMAYMDPDEGDDHRIVLLNPALLQLLPDVGGKRVLDAGCGEGYLSRKLARLGARVTGVDYSRAFLALAQERTDPGLGIRFLHADCQRLVGLASGAFDVVVSNMVLMDLPDHRAALQEFHRVLAEEGTLVFSISHPCFTAPGCGWVRDGDGNKLYWKLDCYFAERGYEQPPPRDADEGTILYHRTLANYLTTLLELGFELLGVVEPKPSEEMMVKYPRFRDDLRMCHFRVQGAQALVGSHWTVILAVTFRCYTISIRGKTSRRWIDLTYNGRGGMR
jgi:SAM-dependent methyltransferase